jgi:hypothetical protein
MARRHGKQGGHSRRDQQTLPAGRHSTAARATGARDDAGTARDWLDRLRLNLLVIF